MDSVNVPVPGRVRARADSVAADLTAAGRTGVGTTEWRVREDHSLVLKRLPDDDDGRLRARIRETLRGAAPVEARVDRVGYFAEEATGPSPVVYLAVESPGLAALHARLVEAFGAVEVFEGEGYVPHVTVARGGSMEGARRVTGPIEPVEWTVPALQFWDATRGAATGRIPLPA